MTVPLLPEVASKQNFAANKVKSTYSTAQDRNALLTIWNIVGQNSHEHKPIINIHNNSMIRKLVHYFTQSDTNKLALQTITLEIYLF